MGAIHKNIEEVSDISWEDLMRMSLENDTIKKLSDAIKGKKYDKSNTNTKLIIQDFEDKNNDVIVIISDGTGSLTIYNSLIELIKNKYNKKYIIGYRLANYENYLNVSDENLIKTLGQYIGEDLYKQNIKKATLIGHCFGGVVALETGRCLNDLNIDNKLIMIDSKIWDKNLLNEIILENIFCHLLGVDLELHGYSLNINDFKFILKNEDYENMTSIDILKKLKEKMPDLVTENRNCGQAMSGIAHTRWATHGLPTLENAHPHSDQSGRIVLVHNGIIENYQVEKERLIADGHQFFSQTDSEVLAHLVGETYDKTQDMRLALAAVMQKISGAYALIALCQDFPGRLFAVRCASPLLIGKGQQENFIASDIPAFLAYTRDVIYLDDKEIVEMDCHEVRVSVDRKSVV